LSIVKQANNEDYWIITHIQNTNSYYVFSLTSSGVNTTPIISTLGLDSDFNSAGFLKFSPKGNKLVRTGVYGMNPYGLLFDFNTSTGVLSNQIILTAWPNSYPDGVNGAEFSPNGELLYVAGSENIRQFDLNAVDIPNSMQTLFVTPGITAMQVAPNGKIYIGRGFVDKLCVINSPNQFGVAANITVDNIDLNNHDCMGVYLHSINLFSLLLLF